jgi:hypothetical protein
MVILFCWTILPLLDTLWACLELCPKIELFSQKELLRKKKKKNPLILKVFQKKCFFFFFFFFFFLRFLTNTHLCFPNFLCTKSSF